MSAAVILRREWLFTHLYGLVFLPEKAESKIVCAVLGHSSVSVTLDIYSHPDVNMQRACLDAWNA